MQQRQPRLGDILDDYCPRERRVTNHAVVAMIDQDVKQTRCTTCDAEHEYKNARVPARKKKAGPATPFEEVLAGMPRKAVPAASPAEPDRAEPEVERERAALVVPTPLPAAPVDQADAQPPPVEDESHAAAPETDGPVHRPLIRATLPRVEGQVKERPIPEFTVRAATNARSGRFRPHGGGGQGGGQGQGGRRGQGQGPAGSAPGGFRFGRRGPGQGPFAAAGAPAHGNRPHAPQGDRQGQRRRGGKKRAK